MQGKPYASAAQRQVVAEHLTRIGRVGKVEPVVRGNFWRVNYATHPGSPTTVLVDGRGSIDLLRCTLTALGGARDRTIESFRVLVDSTDAEQVAGQLASSLGVEFELIRFPAATGLGVAWNAACNGCTGELIVLLVAGISGLTPGWCERLIGYAQNADCGVVAPALFLPDGSFHNAGILLDAELATVRAFLGRQKEYWLPGARQALAQNLTVPGSELLTFRREVHAAIGGFDAHFSDRDLLAADFCLRLRLSGRWNVWTPYVEGLWAGRRASHWAERDVEEVREFLVRWQTWVARDPAYNLNFASGWRTFDLAFPPRNNEAVRTVVSSVPEIEIAEVRDHA